MEMRRKEAVPGYWRGNSNGLSMPSLECMGQLLSSATCRVGWLTDVLGITLFPWFGSEDMYIIKTKI
jgi:hypothetical protein